MLNDPVICMGTIFYLTKGPGFTFFQVISSVFPSKNRFVVHSWVLQNWNLSVSFAGIYFKISMRHNPAKGKMDGYYRLVESYRNADDRVCHRTLLNAGFLDDEVTVGQLKMNTLPEGEANNADGMPEDNAIHDDWREIVRTMNTQKVVTTTTLNKNNEVVILRRCATPNEKVKRIYDKLAYRYQPCKKKKFVVHKSIFEKMQMDDIQILYSQ